MARQSTGIFSWNMTSYKDYIRLLTQNCKTEMGLTQESVAIALGMQKSYFSRVLHGDAHFNEDQLFKFLNISDVKGDARSFIELLHQQERSGLLERKEALSRQIEQLRIVHQQSRVALAKPVEVDHSQELSFYYSNSWCSVVHMYLLIPYYASEPSRICKRKDISDKELEKVLTILQRLGIVVRNGQKSVKVIKKFMHLGSESSHNVPFQINLRLDAMNSIRHCDKDNYHYGVRIVAGKKTKRDIQERWLQFLAGVEKSVDIAEDEEMFTMCFDLFS